MEKVYTLKKRELSTNLHELTRMKRRIFLQLIAEEMASSPLASQVFNAVINSIEIGVDS